MGIGNGSESDITINFKNEMLPREIVDSIDSILLISIEKFTT